MTTSRLAVGALITAEAISNVGNVASLVAVPWLVAGTSGGPAAVGLVAAANALPAGLSVLLGGVLIDRIGFQRMALLSDLLSAVGAAAIARWSSSPLPVLVALVLVGAALDAPGTTARTALMPELAARAGMPLDRANALASAGRRASQLAGAPLAGLLIVTVGVHAALWLDAVTFVAALLVTLACVRSAPIASRIVRRSYAEEFRTGLRTLWRDGVTRSIAVLYFLGGLLNEGLMVVAVTVYAAERLHSAAFLGLFPGVFGGGCLLGSLIAARTSAPVRRRRTILAGGAATTLMPISIGLGLDAPALLAVAAFVGVVVGTYGPLMTTWTHERVALEHRGRVMGAQGGVLMLTTPVAALGWGTVIAWSSPERAAALSGLLGLAAYGGLAARRSFLSPTKHHAD